MFPKPLRREIVILLTAKAAVLALIYFAFFAPASTRDAAAGSTQVHILSEHIP